MATEKTTYLNWDKPTFPSNNLPNELNSLIDQIDVSVSEANGEATWSVSDSGTSILTSPNDLDFKANFNVLDNGDGSVSIKLDRYTDSEAVTAINNETSLSVDISGDADTLDGKHASDFQSGDYTHSELSGISSNDHHAVFEPNDYTPVSDINAETSLSVDITGDADTVDGEDASAFANSGHTHSQLHNKYTDSEAVSAIESGNVETNLPIYATLSDVPTLDQGEVVSVKGDGIYVEK